MIHPGDHVVIAFDNERGDHLHIGKVSRLVVESQPRPQMEYLFSGERVLHPHKVEYQVTIKTEKNL